MHVALVDTAVDKDEMHIGAEHVAVNAADADNEGDSEVGVVDGDDGISSYGGAARPDEKKDDSVGVGFDVDDGGEAEGARRRSQTCNDELPAVVVDRVPPHRFGQI